VFSSQHLESEAQCNCGGTVAIRNIKTVPGLCHAVKVKSEMLNTKILKYFIHQNILWLM